MKFAHAAATAAAAAVLLAGCDVDSSMNAPQSARGANDSWVIDSIGASKSPEQHYVTCVPDVPGGATSGEYREVLISADDAYDDTFLEGDPCPAGVVRDHS